MKKEFVKASFLIIFLVSLFLFLHFSGLHDRFLTPDRIRELLSSAGIFGPLIFMSLYALPILSDSVFAMVGGMVFGPLWGTLYSIIGAAFSTSFAFLIARYLGRDFVANRLRGGWKLFDEDMEKFGFRIILFLRLVPIFPYEGINYGAGLTKIRFRHYFSATILGVIPGAFVYNSFGNFIVRIIDPFYIIPFYLIIFVILGPLIINHYRKRIKTPTKP
jgi:uncharacterized membrane protein YdjX (TVP38/TMEM64 family)